MQNESRYVVSMPPTLEKNTYCVLDLHTQLFVWINGELFKTSNRSAANSMCARLNRENSDS